MFSVAEAVHTVWGVGCQPDGPLAIPPVPDTVGKQASGPPLLPPTVASAAAVPMAAADPAAAGATAAHAGAEQTKDLVKQTFRYAAKLMPLTWHPKLLTYFMLNGASPYVSPVGHET